MVQKFYNILVTKKSENDFVATLPGSGIEESGETEEQALRFLFSSLSIVDSIFDDE